VQGGYSDESLEFYIDNKLVLKSEDNAFATGKAGFTVGTNDQGGTVKALFDDFVITGTDVKNGGHWDPKAHNQIAVEPQGKLSTAWGDIIRQ